MTKSTCMGNLSREHPCLLSQYLPQKVNVPGFIQAKVLLHGICDLAQKARFYQAPMMLLKSETRLSKKKKKIHEK